MKLHTTTAYHPQSNGQTEHVNQELEQYLFLFCNERQDDWNELLPDAEFQYNNHVHSFTQMTPFFLDTGRHPCMGFEPWAHPSENDSVNKLVLFGFPFASCVIEPQPPEVALTPTTSTPRGCL
ncbi:hypothetical protein E4T56_gene2210 [Termitomyces sp. T112]|nr:hypothetical protein E4T56_gene2210 [Termitomyces sp. T112]